MNCFHIVHTIGANEVTEQDMRTLEEQLDQGIVADGGQSNEVQYMCTYM